MNGGSGIVDRIEWLADTLVPLESGDPDCPPDQIRAGIQHIVAETFMPAAEEQRALFPPSKDGTDTLVTLPLVFE